MRVIGKNPFNLAVGSAGLFMVGFYLLLEYLEYGGMGLYTHIVQESLIEHGLIFLLIPLFAALGYVMEKRQRFIGQYFENLEQTVAERTAKLQEIIDRHESYIFSVADGLRNPLQVFMGNLEYMDTSNFTPEQERIFNDIKGAGELLRENITLLTERVGIERAERLISEAGERQLIHESFVENSNDAMYIVDLKGNFTYVNKTAARLMGYKKEELLGKNFSEFLYPDGQRVARENMEKVMAGETVGPHELVIKSARGERIGELTITLLKEGGRPVGILGIARDITERKEMEEALKESERRYRRLVETSPVAIVVHCEGKLVYVNPEAVRLAGASGPEELIGRPVLDFVHPDYRETAGERMQRMLERGEDVPLIQEKFIRLNGEVFDVEITGMPITYDGKPAVQVVFQDITQRKRAEEELEESHRRLQTIIDAVAEPIMLIGTDYRVKLMNKAAKGLYPEPEKIAETVECHRFSHRSDTPCSGKGHPCPLELVRDSRKPVTVTHLHHLPDGTKRYIEILASPLWGPEGTFEGIIETQRDITERKEAEDALRESEEKFRAIATTATDAFVVLDNQGKIVYWNPAAEKIFGYSEEEAMGKDLHLFLAPQRYHDTYKKGFNIFKDTGEGPAIGNTLEFRAIGKDGTEFPIEVSTSAIQVNDQWHAVGIIRDITERKLMEEKLKESEEKFRTLAEYSPNMIFVYGLNSKKILMVNKKCEEVMGYKKEEFYSPDFNIFDLFAPESRDVVRANFESHMKGEDATPFECTIITKDGKRIDAIYSSKLVRYGGERAIIGTVTDITERKRAEEELKKFRIMVESAHDAIFFKDLESRYIIANNKTLETFGLPREKVIGKNDYEIMPNQEEARKNIEDDQVVFRTGKAKGITKHMTGVDGKKYWFQAVKVPHFDEEGKVVGLVGIARDITESKKAERALQESERRYRNLVETMHEFVSEIDMEGRILFVNEPFSRATGYDATELLGTNFFSYLHEDDLPITTSHCKNLKENHEPIRNCEYRFRKKDGTYLTLVTNGDPVFDAQGNLKGVLQVSFDITKRKADEEKLKEYALRLEDSNRLKQLFNDILSHDLFNPLGVVESYIDLIREKGISSKGEAYLGDMERSLRKAREILHDANTYMRLRDTEELEFNGLKITSLLKETLEDLETMIKEKEIQVEFRPEKEVTVPASPIIKEVFTNLISNSIKYSPRGSTLSIDIQDGENLRITFADQGPGIPEEHKEGIFQRYERLEKGAVLGVGLGLAIVKRVVELHGGRVWVEDNTIEYCDKQGRTRKKKQGSIFYVSLPKDRASTMNDREGKKPQ